MPNRIPIGGGISGDFTVFPPPLKRNEIEQPSSIFLSMKGEAFGAWIDGGGRSNAYDEADLIDNPVFQIEAILREAGISAANLTSFDTAAATYGETTAFSWNTQEYVLAKIEALCRETGIIFFVNADGNVTVKRIVAGMEHDFELVEADFLGNNSFLVRRTSPDSLINELLLRYRYSYYKNTFDFDLELSDTENTLASDTRSGFRDGYTGYEAMFDASRTKYNRTYPANIDANFLRNAAAAELFFKAIADWHALQRLVVEADLPLAKLTQDSDHTTFDIEIGDTCLITHGLLPGTTANISGTGGPSGSAIFVVTSVIMNPAPENLSVHVVFQETPFNDVIE